MEEEEEEEAEQNVPPVLSVATGVPLPGSRGVTVDTCNVGSWEGSSDWLCGVEWDNWVIGCVCGSE